MAKKRKRYAVPPPPPPKRKRRGVVYRGLGLPEVDKITESRTFRNLEPTDPRTTTCNKINLLLRGSTNNEKTKEEDRLSRLPDDILRFIISFLALREKARTCVLSTRWRNLWGKSISSLDLCYANLFGCDYLRKDTKTSAMNDVLDFRQRVDQVLSQCCRQFSKLDAMRLSFILSKESTHHVRNWMELVAAHGVREVQLDFSCGDYRPHLVSYHSDCRFPPIQEFSSSLKYLHLSSCIFELPCNFKGFRSLVSMTLEYIYLTESSVQNILSSCPSLEYLSLVQCDFSEPTYLKFTDPSLLLKHLHIYSETSDLTNIDVHDINILSLELHLITYTGVSLKNTPHLARFVIAGLMDTSFGILSSIPHIGTLFLAGMYTKSYQIKLPVLNNLKRLVYLSFSDAVDLDQLVYLLEASPSLQKLELDMGLSGTRNIWLNEKVMTMTERPLTPLTNLKEIEIYGFEDFPEKIELARYLLKNAVVLEKMKIYRTAREYSCDGQWVLFENTTKHGRISSKKICKLLRKEVHSSTELLIESLLPQAIHSSTELILESF